MARPKRVEVKQTGDGQFTVSLPDEYAGRIELNCSTGTVVNYKSSETRRPEAANVLVSREITD